MSDFYVNMCLACGAGHASEREARSDGMKCPFCNAQDSGWVVYEVRGDYYSSHDAQPPASAEGNEGA